MATVLVIGASRGLGLEFVRQYRAAGDRVIATARSDEGITSLKALGAQTLRVDVAKPASNSVAGTAAGVAAAACMPSPHSARSRAMVSI